MRGCLGRTVSFPGRKENCCLGGTACFPGRKVSSGWRGTALFPGKEVSSSLGRIFSFSWRKVSNCLGGTVCFPGRKMSNCLGRTTSFPGGKVSRGLGWRVACLRASWGRAAYFPRRMESWSLGELLPSSGGRWAIAWEGLLPSLEGRWAIAWGKLLPSPGGRLVTACLFGARLLPAWGRLLLLLENLVIFPSFLLAKFWNFLVCLCLTLLNLISPTLSIKPWHSLSLSVEIIDTNFDLHSSVCLLMLSRILLMLWFYLGLKLFLPS